MKAIAFTLLFFITNWTNAQNYIWAKGEGGIGNDAANGIAVDKNGNSYLTGNFAGSADFSGFNIQGGKVYDIFIAKYDNSGNFLWVKNAGGPNNEQGNAIRLKGNYLYITGFMEDSCAFGNQIFLSAGEADVFTAKYDLDGNLIWVRKAGGVGFDYASSIDVDDAGNVYIVGSYENAIQFDTVQLTTNNLFAESFFAKYDSNGNLLWAKTTRGTSTNQLTGVAVNDLGDLYTTGFFGSSFKIDNTTINSNTPSYDILLARLDFNGNLIWMKKAGSTYEDAANAICTDQLGNVFVGGYFAGTASFDNNTVSYYDYNDAFVAKYDSTGNNLWVRAGKGPELDAVFGLTADDDGNVFATGLFETSFEVSGTLLSGPDREVFIISYDANGNLRWATKGGGIQTECGLGVAVKPNGNIVACGYYLHTCTFGNINLDYANANDLFILEFDPPFYSGLEGNVNTYWNISPNYIHDLNQIRFSGIPLNVLNCKIFDISGKEIFSCTLSEDAMPVFPNVLPGIYLVSLQNSLQQITRKLVVH